MQVSCRRSVSGSRPAGCSRSEEVRVGCRAKRCWSSTLPTNSIGSSAPKYACECIEASLSPFFLLLFGARGPQKRFAGLAKTVPGYCSVVKQRLRLTSGRTGLPSGATHRNLAKGTKPAAVAGGALLPLVHTSSCLISSRMSSFTFSNHSYLVQSGFPRKARATLPCSLASPGPPLRSRPQAWSQPTCSACPPSGTGSI